MKLLFVLGLVALSCISTCIARDLIVGTSYNARLIWQEKVEYVGIPFKIRVKQLFYSNPSQQIIKGVIVKEVDQTEGSVTVTTGGVGFSYVNLRLKSERGSPIHYIAEVYV